MSEMLGSGIFGTVALDKAVNRALANIGEDQNTALVAHVDDEYGASLSLVVRAGDHWKFSATVVKGWDQPFKYGAEAVWSGNLSDIFGGN